MRIAVVAHPSTLRPRPFSDGPLAAAPVHGPDDLPDPAGVDAVVLLGGSASVARPCGGTTSILRWCEDVLRAAVPALGICLGAQMLCVAGGGRVASLSRTHVRVREVGAWEPLPGPDLPRTAHFWHGDAMTPPAGSKVAVSPTGHADAFVLPGGRAVGVQFHPETDRIGWYGLQAEHRPDAPPVPYCDVSAGRGRQFVDAFLAGVTPVSVRTDATEIRAVA